MKKFVFGMFIGLLLAIPLSVASAEVISLIGKRVQGSYPVLLNNQRVEKDAIVVDGTSFLPVRTISELFNADVAFVNGEIVITPKGGIYLTDAEKKAKAEELAKKAAEEQAKFDELTRLKNERDNIVLETDKLLKQLRQDEYELAHFNETLENLKPSPNLSEERARSEYEHGKVALEKKIALLKDSIAEIRQKINELEKQAAGLDEQIKQMESTP